MTEEGRSLDREEITQLFDTFEALQDAIPDNTDFSVVMHAVARVLAHGGIQIYADMVDDGEEVDAASAKRMFISGAVEHLSQHYDELMEDYLKGREV